jgi:uncharacterized damage-inducible protein DinB
MNADAFRQYYNYHFAMNRFLWNGFVVPLTQQQYTQQLGYSHGSVKNQLVHMAEVDQAWFSDLRGVTPEGEPDEEAFDDRQALRAYWDQVEQEMRAYLAELRDEQLFDKPLKGEDANLILWQVLLHVVNHGTDHRAQVLRMLNDLGVKTTSQDYVFYLYDVQGV